ncbi:hypothetical protein AVEN_6091-1 [Araneus ventricosus]|uniref:Uncharacterized protein n=1 Tax=Araneus ventricosus TaxID=182803 RepID=A0A4Y2GW38_ARAVE|nr:hypothetical protein AVEN_6091-1 [Araneus ventricosus]
MLIQPGSSQPGPVRGAVVLLERGSTAPEAHKVKRALHGPFTEFCPIAFFPPPSVYSRYTLDTVNPENPSSLTILEIEWPMRRAPTICPRSKVSKSEVLSILAVETTD